MNVGTFGAGVEQSYLLASARVENELLAIDCSVAECMIDNSRSVLAVKHLPALQQTVLQASRSVALREELGPTTTFAAATDDPRYLDFDCGLLATCFSPDHTQGPRPLPASRSFHILAGPSVFFSVVSPLLSHC